MKILFTGGGTMGPVTPLLAVWEAWKKTDATVEGVWVGTKKGPEREVVQAQGLPFFDLPMARFPRYVSFEWVTFPLSFVWAFVRAIKLLRQHRPDLIASAGGYTSVPVVWAGKLLGVKIWVHQQDVEVILTTKLTAPFANVLTVAWEKNVRELGDRALLIGNPVRPYLLEGSVERAHKVFGISPHKPTVLVMGGGGGSAWMNEMVQAIAPNMVTQANIIQITGRGKLIASVHPDHYVCELLDAQMADALAVADVVVSRAGLATMTELSALSKAVVLVALPNSPQEANAQMVGDACVVLVQDDVTHAQVQKTIESLLTDDSRRRQLGAQLHQKLRTDVADELVTLLSDR